MPELPELPEAEPNLYRALGGIAALLEDSSCPHVHLLIDPIAGNIGTVEVGDPERIVLGLCALTRCPGHQCRRIQRQKGPQEGKRWRH